MCLFQSRQARDAEQDEAPDCPSEPFPWHVGAFDAHCHPTDTMGSIAAIAGMRCSALTIMATRSQDQGLVSSVASDLGVRGRESLNSGCAVIPSFGWHPWFSYQLYDDSASQPTYNPLGKDGQEQAKRAHYEAVLSPAPQERDFVASLPTPAPLSSFIASSRQLVASHPHALVGEIGLDKAFRLPRQWDPSDSAARDDGLTPGGREGRLLSKHHVRMSHQQAVLGAQLHLAGELGRPVSVHGVQAHGALYDTIAASWKGHEREVVSRQKRRLAAPFAEDPVEETEPVGGKPFPPRICLHSFSGSTEILKQWLNPATPASIFFSFSSAVNLSSEPLRFKTPNVIREVPDDRILVESDLHMAGENMDAALEDMYRLVCQVKGWGLEEGTKKIRKNFETFIFGA